MNNDDPKRKMIGAVCAVAILVLAALGVLAVFHRGTTRPSDSVCLFNGWIYGREDQKRANVALSSAGLNDFEWRDGRLYAPQNKKNAYMSALASAGAYPRAPSEVRTDAVKEMSAFESDSKTRMRELNACAIQLERTIEQMRGVEYATVGARARREQAGLSSKTIVTASVGVACQEGVELGPNALAAITLAAKHQLGIDSVEHISILDLKEGRSYVGVENLMKESDVALEMEKERLEKYWREKYLEAFSDIKKLRVSVSVDVVPAEKAVSDEDADADSSAANVPNVSTENISPEIDAPKLALAPTFGRFETLRPSETQGNDDEPAQDEAAPAPLNAENDENAQGESATPNQASLSDNSRVASGGFALLGNPKRGGERSRRRERPASIWARNEAQPIPEIEANPFVQPKLLQTAWEQEGTASADRAPTRQAGARALDSARRNGRLSSEYAIRSIVARIAVPRSYIQAAALRNFGGAGRPETFAESDANGSVYFATEEKIVAETRRFAIDLMRPTGERYGWSEEDLNSWISVVVFSDLESFADSNERPRSEHKTSYVPSDEGVAPDFIEETSPTRTYVTADPDGAITEVAPTVAKELSTEYPSEIEARAPVVPVSMWSKARRWASANVLSRFDSALGRNFPYRPVVAAVATLFFLFVVVGALKRSRQRARAANRETNPALRSRGTRVARETQELDYSEFEDEDFDDDAFDFSFRAESQRGDKERERVAKKKTERQTASQRGEYSSKRVETLDLIARYPERAAESLQRWVK